MLAVWVEARACNEFFRFYEPDDQLLAVISFQVYLGQSLVEGYHMRVRGILLENDLTRLVHHFMPVLVDRFQLLPGQEFKGFCIERTGSTVFSVRIFEHRVLQFSNLRHKRAVHPGLRQQVTKLLK